MRKRKRTKFTKYEIVLFVVTGNVPSGWTSIIVSMYFLGGIIMVLLGIIGIYIGYIFNEVKHRPLYVVRSVLNKEKKEKN